MRGGGVVFYQTEELGNGYGHDLIAHKTNLFRGNEVPCCHGNNLKRAQMSISTRESHPEYCPSKIHVPARISGSQIHQNSVHNNNGLNKIKVSFSSKKSEVGSLGLCLI